MSHSPANDVKPTYWIVPLMPLSLISTLAPFLSCFSAICQPNFMWNTTTVGKVLQKIGKFDFTVEKVVKSLRSLIKAVNRVAVNRLKKFSLTFNAYKPCYLKNFFIKTNWKLLKVMSASGHDSQNISFNPAACAGKKHSAASLKLDNNCWKTLKIELNWNKRQRWQCEHMATSP